MLTRRTASVSLTILLAACGGKAIWDPNHHSNHHPTTSAGGEDGTAEVATSTTTSGVGGAGGALATVSSVVSSAASGPMSSATTSVATSASSGGGTVTTSLEEVPLGEQQAGLPVSFDVPEGTLGFTVVVKSSNIYGRMGVRQIESPSKANVVQDYTIKGTQWQYSWYGLTPAGVPQSDAPDAMPKPTPGTWWFMIGDPYENAASADVSIWLRKSSDGAFHGGTVDVNVFRVPSVSSDVYIDAVVTKAYTGWAGLNLGKIAHYPLDEKYASVDGANYLPVVASSAGTKNTPAINVYVIEKFVNEMKDAIGVAAGIPGVGIAPGSHSSGVVISPTSDPDTDAVVLKHESGHLSGLFHTTEIEGGTVDPLGDTLSCSNVPQLLFGCPDAVNIMFPYANPAADEFSMMQETVIHGSTLYHGAFDDLSNGGMSAKLPPSPAKAASESAYAAARSAVAHGAWRAHVSASAATLLSSHWCHQTKNVDHLAALGRLASQAELSAVAADPSTPSWIRSRAARGASRHR